MAAALFASLSLHEEDSGLSSHESSGSPDSAFYASPTKGLDERRQEALTPLSAGSPPLANSSGSGLRAETAPFVPSGAAPFLSPHVLGPAANAVSAPSSPGRDFLMLAQPPQVGSYPASWAAAEFQAMSVSRPPRAASTPQLAAVKLNRRAAPASSPQLAFAAAGPATPTTETKLPFPPEHRANSQPGSAAVPPGAGTSSGVDAFGSRLPIFSQLTA